MSEIILLNYIFSRFSWPLPNATLFQPRGYALADCLTLKQSPWYLIKLINTIPTGPSTHWLSRISNKSAVSDQFPPILNWDREFLGLRESPSYGETPSGLNWLSNGKFRGDPIQYVITHPPQSNKIQEFSYCARQSAEFPLQLIPVAEATSHAGGPSGRRGAATGGSGAPQTASLQPPTALLSRRHNIGTFD